MLKYSLFVLLTVSVLTFGCSTYKEAHYDSVQKTSVDLTEGNYKVIKSNAVGTDRGFNFLGIPIVRPSVVEAMGDLRDEAPMEGKPAAVTNVVQEESTTNFLLFSVPKVSVSADVVEFDKTTGVDR